MQEKSNPPELGGPTAWLVWSLSALAFGYAFFHRVAPSVMVSDLMIDFAIGGAMLGTLSALYFYPYVLLQVPLGALVEKLGPRMLLVVALGTACAGSFIFGTAQSVWLAYLGRILIGVGCSVGFLGSLALASKWFPPHRFAMLSGLSMFFAMISGMMAQAPLALFVESLGWRASMLGLGVIGALLALLIFLFVKDTPSGPVRQKANSKPVWTGMFNGLKEALKSWTVWKIALAASTMSGPMLTLGALWGTPYLMASYALDRPDAAFLVSLLLLGWAVGAPLAGWFSDRIKRRKLILVVGSAAVTVSLAILSFVPTLPLTMAVILLVATGLFGSGMVVSFAYVREMTDPQIGGSALGIVNAMTVASGAILQPLVGLALDYSWDGTLASGARQYTAADYQSGFILIFATSLVGLLICLSLRESNIRQQR